MTKILLPVDGSVLSERVLPVAKRFAGLMDAEILLVRMIDQRERQTSQREEVEDYLLRLCKELGSISDCRVQDCTTVTQGILQVIADEGVDLVIMSSHGRTAAKELPLGSTARDLLRASPVPVMLLGLGVV